MASDSDSDEPEDHEARHVESERLVTLYTQLNNQEADAAGGPYAPHESEESLPDPHLLPDDLSVPLSAVRISSQASGPFGAAENPGPELRAPDLSPDHQQQRSTGPLPPENNSALSPCGGTSSTAPGPSPPMDPWDLNVSALDFDDDGNYNRAWCEPRAPPLFDPADSQVQRLPDLGPVPHVGVSTAESEREVTIPNDRHDRWYISMVDAGFQSSTGYNSPPSPPPVPLPTIETSPCSQLTPPLRCQLTCSQDAAVFLIRYDQRYLHPAVLICNDCLRDVAAGEATVIVQFLPLLLPPDPNDRVWSSIVLRDPHATE